MDHHEHLSADRKEAQTFVPTAEHQDRRQFLRAGLGALFSMGTALGDMPVQPEPKKLKKDMDPTKTPDIGLHNLIESLEHPHHKAMRERLHACIVIYASDRLEYLKKTRNDVPAINAKIVEGDLEKKTVRGLIDGLRELESVQPEQYLYGTEFNPKEYDNNVESKILNYINEKTLHLYAQFLLSSAVKASYKEVLPDSVSVLGPTRWKQNEMAKVHNRNLDEILGFLERAGCNTRIRRTDFFPKVADLPDEGQDD